MSCPVNTVLASAAANGYFSPDAAALQIAIAQLTCDLKAAIASGGLGAGYDSGNIPLGPATTALTHGLASRPRLVRVVIECTTNDAGLGSTVGDQIEIGAFFDTTDIRPNFGVSTNATQIVVQNVTFSAGNEGQVVASINNGIRQPTSANNFRMHVYAWI